MGSALPRVLEPEKVGAETVPAVLIGDKKPTNWHGTEMGSEVFEGTLSRASERTVVTKYVYVAHATLVSAKVNVFGSGNGVPETENVA
jgi:hypothetical protein